MNVGTRYWWLLFVYGWALNDCTSGCIVANIYWTTLEYDECNVIFHGVCWNGIRVHNMWRYEGVVGCMKNQILGSFYEKMSLKWTRLSYNTFCSLIKIVGSSFEWKIHMRKNVHVETRVAMAFTWLGGEIFFCKCMERSMAL
jgi:hypothetical protein